MRTCSLPKPQDVKPLLKDVCRQVFGGAGGLVDMIVAHVPSAKRATAEKVCCVKCASVCVFACGSCVQVRVWAACGHDRGARALSQARDCREGMGPSFESTPKQHSTAFFTF